MSNSDTWALLPTLTHARHNDLKNIHDDQCLPTCLFIPTETEGGWRGGGGGGVRGGSHCFVH